MGRNRDAGTGEFVSDEEAERRPGETVTEETGDPLRALEARVAKLEQAVVLGEAGARALYCGD